MKKPVLEKTVKNQKSIFEIEHGSDKGLGYVFSVVLVLLAFYPLTKNQGVIWQLLLASAGIIAITIFAPSLLRPINSIWTSVGIFLGKIISPMVMSAIYFFSVIPVGITLKLLGKDSLAKKNDRNATTYWIPRGKVKQSIREQF